MAKKNWVISILAVAIMFSVPSCNSGPEKAEDPRVIKLVYTDWSESVAITNLARILLEEHLEYEVILKLTDVESAYREVSKQEADLFLDAWLPLTQKMYFEKYAESIEKLGVIYPEAHTGLLVPEYSPLKTIPDLATYKHPIAGIDSGAGVMHKTRAVLKKYKLNNTLLNLSEEEMTQIVSDSVRRRKNVVVTGWEPHWLLSRYELRFLEDPDNIFGEKEKIFAIGSIQLEDKHPRVVRLLERMQFSEKQFNNLIYEVRVANDPLRGAKNWMQKNTYNVNQWTRNLKPERKKIM
ncbi:MAG: glycine betaine ABC transporter substrate-binding protein [Bacteroidales bacterium]